MSLTSEQDAALARLRKLVEDPSPLYFSSEVLCYDGAYDIKSQRTLVQREQAIKDTQLFWDDLRIVYFPAGSFYVAVNRLEILTEEIPSIETLIVVLISKTLERVEQPQSEST